MTAGRTDGFERTDESAHPRASSNQALRRRLALSGYRNRRPADRPLVDLLTPSQLIAASFLALIAVGTVLLLLPVSHEPGVDIGFIEALFTATSAVCVTGLIVVDTGTAFSGFGEVVIAVLFQLGGLGLLTFGTFVALATGRQLGVGARLRLQEQISATSIGGVLELAKTVAIVAFGAEAAGALILYSRFAATEGVVDGLWYSIFHSASAFNNAGFSLYPDSLSRYVDDPIVNGGILALIIVGGIGFVVIANVFNVVRSSRRLGGPRTRLTLHSRLVLLTTVILIAAGTTLIIITEWNNDGTLGPLTTGGRLLAAVFQAVTPRTAGFNTVDYGQMTTAGQLVTMLLMFIGGSPGSTAGGVKTVTFAVIALTLWTTIRGQADITAFGRRVASETVFRATAIGSGAALLGGAAVTTLAAFEPDIPLSDLLFETVSALGTVGLSTGITADLGTPARLVVVVLMYLGRIGLLSFALALVRRPARGDVRRPAEEVLVG